MSPKTFRPIVLAAYVLAVVATACGEPTAPRARQNQDLLGLSSPSPLTCPTNTSQSTSATIDPLLGGTVSVGGTSIAIPAGALLSPTKITVTVPAGNYMDVDITANDQQHILFQQPVVVTIDYSRCNRSNILSVPLSAWYWDPSTKTLLQHMLGVDNKLTEQVTFSTAHLSSYVIAE